MTYEWQLDLVRNNVRGVTDEQARAITDRCIAARVKGESCSVWHHAAVYFGHTCHCVECKRRSGAA